MSDNSTSIPKIRLINLEDKEEIKEAFLNLRARIIELKVIGEVSATVDNIKAAIGFEIEWWKLLSKFKEVFNADNSGKAKDDMGQGTEPREEEGA